MFQYNYQIENNSFDQMNRASHILNGTATSSECSSSSPGRPSSCSSTGESFSSSTLNPLNKLQNHNISANSTASFQNMQYPIEFVINSSNSTIPKINENYQLEYQQYQHQAQHYYPHLQQHPTSNFFNSSSIQSQVAYDLNQANSAQIQYSYFNQNGDLSELINSYNSNTYNNNSLMLNCNSQPTEKNFYNNKQLPNQTNVNEHLLLNQEKSKKKKIEANEIQLNSLVTYNQSVNDSPNTPPSLSTSSSSSDTNNLQHANYSNPTKNFSKKRSFDGSQKEHKKEPVKANKNSKNSRVENKSSTHKQKEKSKKKKLENEEIMSENEQEDIESSETEQDFNEEQSVIEYLPNGEPIKRVSANKKERRRTQSINNAFSDLRNRIPQIPSDTKLSKIKTLKLATQYIQHLMRRIQDNGVNGPVEIMFKPDLGKLRRECRSREIKLEVERKAKGRTGWPSDVWSTELKKKFNENASGTHTYINNQQNISKPSHNYFVNEMGLIKSNGLYVENFNYLNHRQPGSIEQKAMYHRDAIN